MTDSPRSPNVTVHVSTLDAETRTQCLGQRGGVLWLTGLSGSGKSTLAYAAEAALVEGGIWATVLDGDHVRTGLCGDLGFSPEDRAENLRRVAHAAKLMTEAGLVVFACFVSPTQEVRERARGIVGPERFREVHVATSLETCEGRDPKGLYARARAGEIPEFTGISAPYEPPEAPDLHIQDGTPLAEGVEALVSVAREFAGH
jgi:adenylyl-sulfate kinase